MADRSISSTGRPVPALERLDEIPEKELLRRVHEDGDPAAREELIIRYLPLVRSLARRFASRGQAVEDLVQVGSIGLIKAIDRFDITRGVELSTYATPTVLGEIKRYFRDKGWAVKVPRALQDLNIRLNKVIEQLTVELNRSPTIQELAEHAGVTEEEVLEALESGRAYSSLSIYSSGSSDEDDSMELRDYFKEGAVRFAYEFSTEVLGFDPERIWISVFEGDEQVEKDEEAIAAWEGVGIPRVRMVELARSENFWGPPGPTGPCGPCSELYYDRGPDYGCDDDDCLPGCECDRYVEYWNLVFMQYNMDEEGRLTPLPSKNIDTGMGLERIAALTQDVTSVCETDVFYPLLQLGEEVAGVRFGEDERVDVALRVLADHSRAMSFLVADGVLPGNEGRGYVLRRVIRRAARFGRGIGMEPPYLARFAERTIETLADAYPELGERRETI